MKSKILLMISILLGTALMTGFGFYLKNRNRFSIPAVNMAPNLLPGDVVEGDKEAYKKNGPKRGEVIVYANTEMGEKYISVSRVVGIPGDKIEFPDGRLIVNGTPPLKSSEIIKNDLGSFWETIESLDGQSYTVWYNGDFKPTPFKEVTVPADSYFVASDNRDNSRDSRYIGPIHRDQIKARVLKIVESNDPSRIGKEL